MVVDAAMAVKRTNTRGEVKYPVTAINILKAHGRSSSESVLINGYALNCTVASQGGRMYSACVCACLLYCVVEGCVCANDDVHNASSAADKL